MSADGCQGGTAAGNFHRSHPASDREAVASPSRARVRRRRPRSAKPPPGNREGAARPKGARGRDSKCAGREPPGNRQEPPPAPPRRRARETRGGGRGRGGQPPPGRRAARQAATTSTAHNAQGAERSGREHRKPKAPPRQHTAARARQACTRVCRRSAQHRTGARARRDVPDTRRTAYQSLSQPGRASKAALSACAYPSA